jgi:hypothetical protein
LLLTKNHLNLLFSHHYYEDNMTNIPLPATINVRMLRNGVKVDRSVAIAATETDLECEILRVGGPLPMILRRHSGAEQVTKTLESSPLLRFEQFARSKWAKGREISPSLTSAGRWTHPHQSALSDAGRVGGCRVSLIKLSECQRKGSKNRSQSALPLTT